MLDSRRHVRGNQRALPGWSLQQDSTVKLRVEERDGRIYFMGSTMTENGGNW